MMRMTLLVAVLMLAGCRPGDEAVMLGTLERDRLELVAEAHETIVELLVREGDRVEAGTLLLRLDPATADARLEQARSERQRARAVLAEAVSGPRREQILAARATLAGAQARLQAASSEFDRVESLVRKALLPQADLDRQRAARDGALAERDAARERLQELEQGTRSEVLDQAQAALQAAEAQVAGLELSRSRLDLRAPRSGLVEALPYELGERPPAGAPVVVMLADGRPYARVFVPEPLRASVTAGTAVTIRLDGSGRDWQGRVRYVSSDAAFTPYYALNERDRSRLSYLAEVDLVEDDASALPTGMPVEARLAGAPTP
jgi:HlyD family secretion protein